MLPQVLVGMQKGVAYSKAHAKGEIWGKFYEACAFFCRCESDDPAQKNTYVSGAVAATIILKGMKAKYDVDATSLSLKEVDDLQPFKLLLSDAEQLEFACMVRSTLQSLEKVPSKGGSSSGAASSSSGPSSSAAAPLAKDGKEAILAAFF